MRNKENMWKLHCLSRLFFVIFLSALLLPQAFPRGKYELIKAGSWVYDALSAIAMEEGRLDFTDRSPLSVEEVLFFLNEADYSSLSLAGQAQYDRIINYCNQDCLHLGSDFLHAAFELEVNAEGYYKGNSDLPWVFDRYDKGSFLLAPVKVEAGDYFTMLVEAKLAVNKNHLEGDYNYVNIPYSMDMFDINFPDTAYFSTGHAFGDKMGLTFQIGQAEGEWTRSLTGSIAESRYFTGATFAELGFYARNFRYSMNVEQFNVDKYLYSHEASLRLFKRLQFSAKESILAYAPMELRYLNPWTIYHGFSAWRDYGHNESNTCDFLALGLTYTPIKCLRLYFNWAMTQVQTPYETSHWKDDTTPRGFAYQTGVESFIPITTGALEGGYLHMWFEGTYTDPYMYLKDSPDWSMVRNYRENIGDTKEVFYEWYGTPFGPDTIAGKISVEYEKPAKWSVGFSYLLKVGGRNSGTKIFDGLDWHEGEEYVIYGDDDDDESRSNRENWTFPDADSQGEDEAKSRQKAKTPWGTNEYVNVISIRGTYSPKENITLFLQPSYTFVFNYDNESGKNKNGFEVATGISIKLL